MKLNEQRAVVIVPTRGPAENSLTLMLAILQSLLAYDGLNVIKNREGKVRRKVSGLSFQPSNIAVERGKVCHERQTGTSLRKVCATIDR